MSDDHQAANSITWEISSHIVMPQVGVGVQLTLSVHNAFMDRFNWHCLRQYCKACD